jgi:ankyrin repeat protein
MVAEWHFGGGWRDLTGREKTKRLAMAQWMIENGSDVHQGGDGPLMRAALFGARIPMMELLVQHGADVNAVWHGEFPIIFSPCETLDPTALRWLLDHGADPNCADPKRKYPGTALDYAIGSYGRSPELRACIDMLVAAGGTTRFEAPPVLDILCSRTDRLVEHLDAEPELLTRRFPELDFGTTGGRLLTLRGATLLHVAAEYRNLEATTLHLNRGADVNALAMVDDAGVGGQTAIFHAVTQNEDLGLPVARVLVDCGADLSIRAKIPGHYERPDEVVECTPFGYALRFENEPERSDKVKTVAFLRGLGAPE